jgi:hypothetical protein
VSAVLRIPYESDAEMRQKLCAVMEKLGYVVTRRDAPLVTMAVLSREVGRSVASVSRSLRRAGSPPFFAIWGTGERRRRIIRIRPDERLLAYLRT